MKRSIILVLDSLGLGSTEDSHLYGDTGADTLGHIIESCDSDSANNLVQARTPRVVTGRFVVCQFLLNGEHFQKLKTAFLNHSFLAL